MKSTVETLGPTRVRLAIEVPFAELEPSLKKAYREIAQQVNIPGFRRGKAPAAVIDRRIGREVVLNEAVQEAIPQQLMAAIQEHEVRSIGRPQVDNVEIKDGEPLRFTAEVDVRPEIELPDPAELTVTVDEITVTDEEIDKQLELLRERFATLKNVERPVAEGDYVQIDLEATVDGQPVEGGSATNLSHEVGSKSLLPGLDEAVVGLSAGESTTFTAPLVAGEHAGREAEVTVTVKTVREKELPQLDDEFAQLASEFDTLSELRDDTAEQVRRIKHNQQLVEARDKLMELLLERTGVPAPEGVVRDEVNHRKQHLVEDLERMGRALEEYLSLENKTEEELDQELTEAVSRGVRNQLVLDAVADAEEVQVSDEEFGQEIVMRAQQVGMAPQQYYDQLVRAGAAGSVFSDVRRNKALRLLMERVTITDTAGNRVSVPTATTAEAGETTGTPDQGEGAGPDGDGD
ncbi:MAG TPA: trigger factor [Natronosporangium sp.]|nr:trigger factor [Natronosporangium sp.]